MARGGGQVPGRGAQASHSLLQVRTHSHPPPPTPLHHIPAASTELILWGRPGVDRATVLPSRHGLLPGLRSGPQPDSRLLFPFAQRNPLPQGSSQRRCAAKERPWILETQGSKQSSRWELRHGRAVQTQGGAAKDGQGPRCQGSERTLSV